jgi:WD40 repeat protein
MRWRKHISDALSVRNYTVRLWDPHAGQELDTLTGHEGTVFSLAFSANGKLLASGGYDGHVRL